MTIQWFPGHMHKARKEVAKTLPQVDVVLEVLDARIPYSSQNPMIADIVDNKQRIKVLKKSDLADSDKTAVWLQFFSAQPNTRAVAVSTEHPEQIKQLIPLIKSLIDPARSEERMTTVMIMGIPNVGKSTLINTLAGKKIAKTGNEPAITKGQQRIKLEQNIVLIDTPGMMWPKVENENSAYRLASTGAIKDTAISHLDVAYFAVDFMLRTYPERLQQRYDIAQLPNTEIECLELMGAARGCLGAGGRVDLNRISTLFLNDLRQGALGTLTLEMPDIIAVEQHQVAEAKALKEKRDQERKEQRKLNASKRRRKK